MMTSDERTKPTWFQDASIQLGERAVHFTAEEGRTLESPSQYWHGPGSPSSWLGAAVCLAVREKMPDAPLAAVLELAAQAMGMTVDSLQSLIEWHENYMRWHDGDPDYRLFSESPAT